MSNELSTQPLFHLINNWHKASDIRLRMSFQVWYALLEDEFFQAVKAVERRIQRVAGGALITTPAMADASFGNPTLLLQWKELKMPPASQSSGQPVNQPTAPPLDCFTITRDFFPELT